MCCSVLQQCVAVYRSVSSMFHSHRWRDVFICVTCHGCVLRTWLVADVWHDTRHDSFIYVTWFSHVRDMTLRRLAVTWRIDMSIMTHWYVWDDSLICVRWLIHHTGIVMWYVYHDSLICVPWLVDMCEMTHASHRYSHVICVPWLIDMCTMTRWYVWDDSCITQV